ncbi:glycosyltransferase [Anaerolinea thermolimosa]|uniref:glycosyltransferase n=1 Tax=Anaerolinea thermolimosa TaxID=229919 RepID=UPI000781D226|nr:glycosyltransferase [Anaerolinea thermolimosa]GAP07776.1 glycosyltransferase [Anaerolinea thermolimosa]
MRIAHCILGRCNSESANGVDKTVYYLALHQAKAGEKVAVFSITDKEPLPIPGVEVIPIPSVRKGLLIHLPFSFCGLEEKLLEWKPDIVHFHSVHIGPFIAVAQSLRQKKIPYIVTPNGGYALEKMSQSDVRVKFYTRWIEKSYLENAFFVHAVSQNDILGLKTLGINPRFVKIPNGIDLENVPSITSCQYLAVHFPELAGRRLFLFLGRLDPSQKGLDILLEAFALANPENAALVLAGPDWHGSIKKLKILIAKLGITERVVFTGPVFGEEKWALFNEIDIYIQLSRWEGLSLSILEALAAGKPVIASRQADPDEMINRFMAGETVVPEVGSIAGVISRFSKVSRLELGSMGENARQLARNYEWKILAGDMLRAYVH